MVRIVMNLLNCHEYYIIHINQITNHIKIEKFQLTIG